MFKMKKILVLIFCFLNIIFPSTETSNEKITSYPSTVQMQMQKLNNFTSTPGVELNEEVRRIFSPAGSNCLKNLNNQFRYKNRSGYRKPFGMIKPLRRPAFKSAGSDQQIPFLYKMRQNQLQEHQNTRRPLGNNRIIFVPPYVKSNKKRVNFFQNAIDLKINKTLQSNSHEGLSTQEPKNVTNEARQEISVEGNPKQMEKNIKTVKIFLSDKESLETEKLHMTKNSTAFDDVHGTQSKIIESSTQSIRLLYKTSEIPQRSNKIITTTEKYSKISSHHFWYQKTPTQTQPYEVEEIIEEELSVDLDNEKIGDVQSPDPFERPELLTKEIKKVTSSENGQKTNGIQDMVGSSINTVIKSLMSPMMKVFPTVENIRESFPKKKIQNRPIPNNYLTSISPRFTTFLSERPPNSHKIINNNRFLANRYEQAKHLKMKSPQINERFQNWTRKTTEPNLKTSEMITKTEISNRETTEPKKITLELNGGGRVNVTPPFKVEFRENVHTTGTTEIFLTPLNVKQTEKNILNVKKNPQQKTTAVTEIEDISLSSSEPKFNDQISFTPLETQKILKSLTTQKTFSVKTQNPSTNPTQTTLNEISSSQEFTTAKSTQSTNLLSEFIENSTEAKTSPDEPYSEITINKADLTISDFQDFIDDPKTSDLITTVNSDLKKNQDSTEKNSRKMHFHYDLHKTTTSNAPFTSSVISTELESTGPRRSDILITENFNDYAEVDNNLSVLNYLDKLKQNNSFPLQNSLLHSEFESIIALIPVVVNDLREGRVSPEDISILSMAFGKYWPSITILANVTNLDMLPLLKMKNEEDWNNIWQSFFPETIKNTELTTVKTTEIYSKQESDDYSPYDYLSEYDDFYEYVFESEKEEKEKKRKKPRTKRDEEDNLNKIEAFREYFESAEEEDSTVDNMYEDMFYIETSEDKDSSEFEMKLKTVDLNFRNVTLQTRNDVF